MTDEREQNLPKWAQMHIVALRNEIQARSEALTREVARLRPRNDLLEKRLCAMEELLECAARGGHIEAKTIVETLAGHSLVLAKDE